jgi:hypothetical protein
MVEVAEFNANSRTAVFRLSLPLERFAPGRYAVQAVVIQAGGEHAAFARNYFALRNTARPLATSGGGK